VTYVDIKMNKRGYNLNPSDWKVPHAKLQFFSQFLSNCTQPHQDRSGMNMRSKNSGMFRENIQVYTFPDSETTKLSLWTSYHKQQSKNQWLHWNHFGRFARAFFIVSNSTNCIAHSTTTVQRWISKHHIFDEIKHLCQ